MIFRSPSLTINRSYGERNEQYYKVAEAARVKLEADAKKSALVNIEKLELAKLIDAMSPVEHMQGFIVQTMKGKGKGKGKDTVSTGGKGKSSSSSGGNTLSGKTLSDKSGRKYHINYQSLVTNLSATQPEKERLSTITDAISAPHFRSSPGLPGARTSGKGKESEKGKSKGKGKGKDKSKEKNVEPEKGKSKGKSKNKGKGKEKTGKAKDKGKGKENTWSRGRGRGQNRSRGRGRGRSTRSNDWWS